MDNETEFNLAQSISIQVYYLQGASMRELGMQ